MPALGSQLQVGEEASKAVGLRFLIANRRLTASPERYHQLLMVAAQPPQANAWLTVVRRLLSGTPTMATRAEVPDSDFPETAGPVLAGLVREQLELERRRKASFEQRGIAVITSAGVLAGLVLGVAGIAGKTLFKDLRWEAKGSAILAVVLFTVAAVLGLATNWAPKIIEPDLNQLSDLVNTHWNKTAQAATKFATQAYLMSLTSYRKQGNRKARLLIAALAVETAAIFFVAAAVTDYLYFGLK